VNRSSASEEITHILWQGNIHYPVHSTIFTSLPYDLFFIILPFTSRWSHSFNLSDQSPLCISIVSHSLRMTSPSHSPNLIKLINLESITDQ